MAGQVPRPCGSFARNGPARWRAFASEKREIKPFEEACDFDLQRAPRVSGYFQTAVRVGQRSRHGFFGKNRLDDAAQFENQPFVETREGLQTHPPARRRH